MLYSPADTDDLAAFLAARRADVPVSVIGLGSNILVRDGGVPGVVVRLGRGLARVRVRGAEVHAGAGASDVRVANAAAKAGLEGLEFLAGIPGTVGGALSLNGGAYGREMKDVTVAATALDAGGTRHELDADALGFGYRRSSAPADWIFVDARLRGTPGDPALIERRMDAIRAEREASQPVRARTGGSTFKNPPGAAAWKLIERAGLRGLARGGAMVSAQHCNFLVNTGGASAADLEGLGEEVRRRVFEATGVRLEWEIRRIGVPADAAPREVTP